MDFDGEGIYYSQQNLQRRDGSSNGNVNGGGTNRNGLVEEEGAVDGGAVRRHFREFLRHYRQQEEYVYRQKLLQLHRRGAKRSLSIDLAHLREYDAALLDYVLSQPTLVLPFMEHAAVDALETLLFESSSSQRDGAPQSTGDPQAQEVEREKHGQQEQETIQILLCGNLSVTALRSIQSHHMNKLVKVSGIVISAAKVRSRATKVALACTKCAHRQHVTSGSAFFASIPLPTSCVVCPENNLATNTTTAVGTYSIVPDECVYMDQQTLKLQEAPETVPTGEMPRSVLCCVDRTLVDKAPPGTRLTFFAIASMFSSGTKKSAYLQVVGLSKGGANEDDNAFTPAEENAFRTLARRPNIYELLTSSIAPSISGDYTTDIKKALLCMLMGGCRKRLPDGCQLRGDINVLLLGDPSMAKSQFLKYATRVAPIGVYTSGKGSSAAGLTASVVRDARGEFYLEGGAMVLADGGLVAIDEFDKMNPTDRVAIHEAMEQQTISIAKAGITTVLNSRTSVLAAANPVYGRYDELKSASDNIDLLSTILSRFDLIFLLKDSREAKRDKAICRHIMGVHIHHSHHNQNSNIMLHAAALDHADSPDHILDDALLTSSTNTTTNDASHQTSSHVIAENAMKLATTGKGELHVPTMKKYIQYCKRKCMPRLSEEAGELLASAYVKIRNDVRLSSSSEEDSVIPITVRQLEALIRLSESLARLRLQDQVGAIEVAEALRLFRVSTMAAQQQPTSNNSNSEELQRTEAFLTTRLTTGITVNKQRIVEEAASKGYNAMLVAKVLSIMVMRGQLQERNQGRLLKRIR